MTLTVTDQALDELAKRGFDPAYGARPLRRQLRRLVEDPLAEMFLAGTLTAGDRAQVLVRDGEVLVEKVDEPPAE